MISKDPVLRLRHIRYHILGVIEILKDADFGTFSASYALVRATERGISIISEAAKLLPPTLRGAYPEIPWSRIIGIGNLLRHEYERIDVVIMWDIAQNHLPAMLVVIETMIVHLSDEA